MSMLLLLCVILGGTCLVGDWVGSAYSETQRLQKAVVDNATHALIGALTIVIVIYSVDRRSSNAFLMILAAFMISSLIDLDHFLQAKSFLITDAIHLSHRPFLHCSTILLIIAAIWSIPIYMQLSFDCIMWIAVVFCSFASHHIRDATRRGLWFYPIGSTAPIPYVLYILLIVFMPLGISAIIKYVITTQMSLGKQYKIIAFSSEIHEV